MKESKKLKIRIDFSTQPNNIATDDITYDWGKIVGAFIALIIVIGLFIGGGSYYFDQDNADHIVENQEEKSIKENSALVDQIEKISSTTTPSAEDITTTANSETVLPYASENENKNKDVIQTVSTKITTEISVKENREPDLLLTQADTDVLSDQDDVAHQQTKTASTEVTSEISAIGDVESETLFKKLNSEIHSDKIKRFIISSSVSKNEPAGTINDIVFDSNNLATVYAFSDVINLEGTTLYYIWTLDGEDIAKVKVKVRSARWRSYSSKFIQPNMHGEWKVELQNGKGEKLASSLFYY